MSDSSVQGSKMPNYKTNIKILVKYPYNQIGRNDTHLYDTLQQLTVLDKSDKISIHANVRVPKKNSHLM